MQAREAPRWLWSKDPSAFALNNAVVRAGVEVAHNHLEVRHVGVTEKVAGADTTAPAVVAEGGASVCCSGASAAWRGKRTRP